MLSKWGFISIILLQTTPKRETLGQGMEGKKQHPKSYQSTAVSTVSTDTTARNHDETGSSGVCSSKISSQAGGFITSQHATHNTSTHDAFGQNLLLNDYISSHFLGFLRLC